MSNATAAPGEAVMPLTPQDVEARPMNEANTQGSPSALASTVPARPASPPHAATGDDREKPHGPCGMCERCCEADRIAWADQGGLHFFDAVERVGGCENGWGAPEARSLPARDSAESRCPGPPACGAGPDNPFHTHGLYSRAGECARHPNGGCECPPGALASPAAPAGAAREDPGVDRAWVAAAMKAIEGLTAGEASFTGHPIVDCVAQLRAALSSASATEAALRAEVERLTRERDEACEALADLLSEFDTLRTNARYGTTWDGSRTWFRTHPEGGELEQRARAVLAGIRKETPDHE